MRYLFILLAFVSASAYGQSIGYWRYDTVVLQKVGGNSELKIMNGTRSITGGLFTNTGNGVGRWIKPRKVVDTLFIGLDTFVITSGTLQGLQDVMAFNPVLGLGFYNNVDVNSGSLQIGETAGLGSGKGILVDMANDAISLMGTAGAQHLQIKTGGPLNGQIIIQNATANGLKSYIADSLILGKIAAYNKTRMKLTPDSIFIKNLTSIGTHAPSNVMVIDTVTGQIRSVPKSSIASAQGIFANSIITNYSDSLKFRDVNAFKTPTSALLVGTSIEAGSTPSTADSALAPRITVKYGLTVNNLAAASRGAWLAVQRALANVNPGHSIATFFTGWFNDWRRGGSGRKTQNKTVHTAKSAFVNQMLSTYLDAGGGSSSITFTGSWTGYSASTVGGKSNGKYTTTSGDTLIYTFTGYTNIAFGVIGMDGTTNAGANFEWYIVNAVTNAIVYSETGKTTNFQYDAISDGTYDNSRGPMAFLKLGLTSTTSYKLKIVSKQSTNVLAVDYVGHMVDPVDAVPIVWMKPTRMDATGYATVPNSGSDVVWDANNLILDSLYSAILTEAPNYPVYLSETDDHFQPSTAIDLYSDHIHLQDHGFYDYALTIFEALPTISVIPTANTVISVNGLPYYSDGTQLLSMTGGGGSGTPGGSVTQLQYNNAGAFGGISSATSDGDDLMVDTLFGGTGSAGKLIFQTTQHATKGEIRLGTTGTIDDNNGRMGLSSANTISSTRLYIVGNTGILGDDLLQMKMVTSQTGSMLKILDASGVITKQISSTGAEMIGAGDWSLSYPKPALYAFRNGGSQYMRFYNGSTWEPVVMEGISWTFKTGAGVSSLTANSSGTWAFANTTTFGADAQVGHQAATGDVNATAVYGSSGTNWVTLMPSLGTGSSSSGVMGSYFNGSAWKSAWEYSNTTGAAATNLLLLKGGGKVGIGTSSPTHTLTVADNLKIITPPGTSDSPDSLAGFKDGVLTAYTSVSMGTYTPTLTNVTNVSASTAYACQYIRVGNAVIVSGMVDLTPTTGGLNTELGISLPFASALANNEQCGGSGASESNTENAAIFADPANDRARIQYAPAANGSRIIHFQFTYQIL